MAGAAVVIPLVVVLLASLVYFRRGRTEQFRSYLAQAEAAATVAQSKGGSAEARADWEMARQWLELAAVYGANPESQALELQVQQALDALDLVVRLDFRPVVSGGFGPEARITGIAASSTDLYLLDETYQVIWHAWSTGRGYEIDRNFDCLSGPDSVAGMGSPVDLVIQNEPGALGVEGVVAIDQDGTLLYCAPDRRPATTDLEPPDVGWKNIRAIDVFADRLYVLDTEANSVWIYDASGGLFSGSPLLYFAEEVPDLSDAIDLAMAQEDLFILHADGRLDRCRRVRENAPGGGVRIRVECELNPRFQDERPDREPTERIPGALPIAMAYSPPPEPSLYFLDSLTDSVYHYSMRLVYQGRYRPAEPFPEGILALGLGPPNDLFLAVGSDVYFAQPAR
jgi:hypothetical protein